MLDLINRVLTGTMFLVAIGWLLVQLTNLPRHAALDGLRFRDILSMTPDGATSITIPSQLVADGIIACILVMLIHELAHGRFFWRFTGKRPTLGIKRIGVYVAEPSGIYLPRNRYVVVGIAPLVLLTLVGLLLLMVAPVVVVPILTLFVALNAGGAAGDLLMAARLLSYSPDTLMRDSGTSVIVYGPQN